MSTITSLTTACRSALALIRKTWPLEHGNPEVGNVWGQLEAALKSPAAPEWELHLFHGRRTPDEELDDWGFDGPVIKGIAAFSCTYFTTFRVTFADEESYQAAKSLTGWNPWDELTLEITGSAGLVTTTGEQHGPAYYGDWSLRPLSDS